MVKKTKTIKPTPKAKSSRSSRKSAPEMAGSGHVIISKAALKSLQDGMTRLELTLAEIANALRVLE